MSCDFWKDFVNSTEYCLEETIYSFGSVGSSPFFLALFIGHPDPESGGVEVSAITDDTAYDRQVIHFTTELSGGISINTQNFEPVVYGTNGIAYTINYLAIFQELTGGTYIAAFSIDDVIRSTGSVLSISTGSFQWAAA